MAKIKKNLLAALILSQLIVCSAYASGQISINVKNPDPYTGNQSWFVYQNQPGDVIQDIATVKNYSNAPAVVKVYPVDATSNDSGDFILTSLNEPQKDLGIWTTLKTSSYVIKPGEKIDVPFTVTLPKELSPGQYFGGLIAETAASTPECKNCGTSVNINTRIGSRIYLTVPGETKEDIQWLDFSAGNRLGNQIYLQFKFQNKGNISYEPNAVIELFDSKNQRIASFNKSLGIIMPNKNSEPTVTLDNTNLSFGRYTVKATINFTPRFQTILKSKNLSMNKIATVWFLPWGYILTIIFILIAGVSIYLFYQVQIDKLRAISTTYSVGPGETILSISEKFKMNWRILARVNKLKAPYHLDEGEKILVPNLNDKKKKK